jgi:hypothetical protein
MTCIFLIKISMREIRADHMTYQMHILCLKFTLSAQTHSVLVPSTL